MISSTGMAGMRAIPRAFSAVAAPRAFSRLAFNKGVASASIISRPVAAATPSRSLVGGWVRFYTPQSLDTPAKEVDYNEVAKIVKDAPSDIVVVDVREPDEYAAGHLPGAVNVPFRSSPGALGLDPAEFKETFGFDKPDPSKTLLLYCRAGVRSQGAEQLAATYGYKNRLNYGGSFDDWTTNKGTTVQ